MADTSETHNLAKLSQLTVDTILDALRVRFENNVIYTYVGDILIAMNPYQSLPIYTQEHHDRYKNGKDAGPVPHIFAIAVRAYEAMVNTKSDQCFVVSGESGAGKTESTKLMVKHIIELCRSGNQELETQVVKVNPVLETFGNAKTGLNDNSSRFGKYLELRFDSTGAITGAFMRHYLLEKSRVTMRNKGERNFHIFYLMFAGLNAEGLLAEYQLERPGAHQYLNKDEPTIDSMVFEGQSGDRFLKEWKELLESFEFVKFSTADIEDTLKAMAAILHIGDVSFPGGRQDPSSIAPECDAQLKKVKALLSISDESAFKDSFLFSTGKTRGAEFKKQYIVEDAVDNRDAMAKMIYDLIFEWIFESVNELLAGKDSGGSGVVMGLLDIFGFEKFEKNSLEQMCINITNEQLQKFFNHFIFEMEQIEYEAEGIDVSKITHIDNQPTLDLFLSKTGIFSILNEQSRFPNADDLSFTQKCKQQLDNHQSGSFRTSRADRDLFFWCTHYAGEVKYTTEDFLEKNRDKLSGDVVNVFKGCGNKLIARLFSRKAERDEAAQGKRKAVTMAGHFQTSLHDLIQRLETCQPHFVRCIKPNEQKTPKTWEPELVRRQLEYAGVLETIKMRKLGYSFRLPYEAFAKRYKILAFKDHEQPPMDRSTVEKICSFIKLENFQYGNTKIFMKYNHFEILASKTKEHTDALVLIQRVVKGYLAREEHMRKLQEKRRRDRSLRAILAGINDTGKKYSSEFEAMVAEDEREADNRPWLKQVMNTAAMMEIEKQSEDEERKAALEKAQREVPTKEKTKSVNGYFVWRRNEHLTLKVGALPHPWRKRLDEATGRYFFKNMEEKRTTWIDPRTFETRPHDAAETVGDELPYGWDEAETDDGVTFYINHLTNTHHKHHPREQLEKMEASLEKKKNEAAAKEQPLLAELNQLRAKRQNLITLQMQAADEDERVINQDRLQAVEEAISKLQDQLDTVRDDYKAYENAISHFKKRKSQDEGDIMS